MHTRKIGFRDGLILSYVLVAFVCLAVVVLEAVCAALRCPSTDLPLPALIAMALVIPFQRRLLDLWHRHRRSMLFVTASIYVALATLLWAISSGRLVGWP